MLPRISIITPSYNQAQFIEKTVLSVVSQNYPNLEYIVMDGGSNDGTLEILKKYKGKLLWFSQKDEGQSDAINNAMKKAKGEILGYLNSDDLLQPESLHEVAEYFQEYPKISWVTGRCYMIDDKGELTRSCITSYKNFWLKYCRTRNALAILNFISQPATFWRREVVDKIGFFDRSLYYAMDYDYWLRLSKIYRLGFIDKHLASFRIHKVSKSRKNVKGLFSEGYQVAGRYINSPLIFLHKLHDILSILTYKLFYYE